MDVLVLATGIVFLAMLVAWLLDVLFSDRPAR